VNQETRIEYKEHTIETVLQFFVDNYKPGKRERISKYDASYDPHTGLVWFRLYIERD